MSNDVAEFIEMGLLVLWFGAFIVNPFCGENGGFDARCIRGVAGRIYRVVKQQHRLVAEDVVGACGFVGQGSISCRRRC